MTKAKALDGFLEKPAKDSGFDFLASRALSREVDGVLRNHFEQKQRMSVSMNYFAIACPIMPTFLLGAFMLLDKLDNMYDKTGIKQNELAREQTAQSQALYIAAMREKAEKEGKKAGLECSRPIEGLPPVGKDKLKAPKKKSSEILQTGKPTERMGGPVLLSKSQTDLSKIVKKKMALEAHLDEMNKEQDFAGVCNVSAQIQLLDKALKQLGC
jgi:hypothetical protein